MRVVFNHLIGLVIVASQINSIELKLAHIKANESELYAAMKLNSAEGRAARADFRQREDELRRVRDEIACESQALNEQL